MHPRHHSHLDPAVTKAAREQRRNTEHRSHATDQAPRTTGHAPRTTTTHQHNRPRTAHHARNPSREADQKNADVEGGERKSGTADRDRGRIRGRRTQPARRSRGRAAVHRGTARQAQDRWFRRRTTSGRRALRVRLRRARITAVPIRLGFLGDSTAAGQGVTRPGRRRARFSPRRSPPWPNAPWSCATWRCPGAQSDDLERQVTLLLSEHDLDLAPDVCVIMIGANDVTHRMPPSRAVRLLSDGGGAAAHRRMRGGGRHLPRSRLHRAGRASRCAGSRGG